MATLFPGRIPVSIALLSSSVSSGNSFSRFVFDKTPRFCMISLTSTEALRSGISTVFRTWVSARSNTKRNLSRHEGRGGSSRRRSHRDIRRTLLYPSSDKGRPFRSPPSGCPIVQRKKIDKRHIDFLSALRCKIRNSSEAPAVCGVTGFKRSL